MKKYILIVCCLIPAFAIAGQYEKQDPNSIPKDSKAQKKDIQVFNGLTADRPFVVIGELHAKASDEKLAISKIKRIADENNADAILNYKTEHGGASTYWTGAVLQHVSGVAVRWAAEGETGVTKIDPNASIPVIQ